MGGGGRHPWVGGEPMGGDGRHMWVGVGGTRGWGGTHGWRWEVPMCWGGHPWVGVGQK